MRFINPHQAGAFFKAPPLADPTFSDTLPSRPVWQVKGVRIARYSDGIPSGFGSKLLQRTKVANNIMNLGSGTYTLFNPFLLSSLGYRQQNVAFPDFPKVSAERVRCDDHDVLDFFIHRSQAHGIMYNLLSVLLAAGFVPQPTKFFKNNMFKQGDIFTTSLAAYLDQLRDAGSRDFGVQEFDPILDYEKSSLTHHHFRLKFPLLNEADPVRHLLLARGAALLFEERLRYTAAVYSDRWWDSGDLQIFLHPFGNILSLGIQRDASYDEKTLWDEWLATVGAAVYRDADEDQVNAVLHHGRNGRRG